MKCCRRRKLQVQDQTLNPKIASAVELFWLPWRIVEKLAQTSTKASTTNRDPWKAMATLHLVALRCMETNASIHSEAVF